MRVRLIVLVVLAALLLAWVVTVLAQEEPPGVGQKIDAALLLAGPAFAVVAWLAGQLFKYVFKDSQISTGTIVMIVRIGAGVVLVVGFSLGYDAQIEFGIGWLNQASSTLQQILLLVVGLLTMVFGSNGLYQWAKARNVPVIGQKQGDVMFGYARDQTDDWQKRRAA